ncbi:uncharacterized protein LOC142803273 isoform X2 [Rhipicephalus microplus]|uniref:uncharacterized protein LOC142803273 isoform X2 n=1 Tax=Rhipicephalus microplus TaxID=6941 RepID=UPI003F6CD3F3
MVRGWRVNGLPDSERHSDQTLLPREASVSQRHHRDMVRKTRVSHRPLHVQTRVLHPRDVTPWVTCLGAPLLHASQQHRHVGSRNTHHQAAKVLRACPTEHEVTSPFLVILLLALPCQVPAPLFSRVPAPVCRAHMIHSRHLWDWVRAKRT